VEGIFRCERTLGPKRDGVFGHSAVRETVVDRLLDALDALDRELASWRLTQDGSRLSDADA